jgi:hypothetical protein
VLDSFFPHHHPPSIEDMPPFNKSKLFTLTLKLSALTFALLLGHHFFFEQAYFHKIKGSEQYLPVTVWD